MRSLSEALEQRAGTLSSAEWLGTEPWRCTDSPSRKPGGFGAAHDFLAHATLTCKGKNWQSKRERLRLAWCEQAVSINWVPKAMPGISNCNEWNQNELWVAPLLSIVYWVILGMSHQFLICLFFPTVKWRKPSDHEAFCQG